MSKLQGVLVGAIVALVSACISPARTTVNQLAPLIGEGFQCLVAPSSFDPPGTVFSIDAQGVKDYVTDLSTIFPAKTEDLAVGTYTADLRFTGNFLVSLLKPLANLSALEVKGDVDRKRHVEVRLEPPVIEEITFTDKMDPVLDWFEKFVRDRKYDPKNKYFLVRQAVLAKGVTYKMDKELVADLGGEATITQYVKANASLNSKSSDTFDLTQTFPRPLRVCIQPRRLMVVSAGLDGSAGVAVEGVRAPLEIQKVRSSSPKAQ